MSRSEGLSPEGYAEAAKLLDCARDDLLDVAAMTKCFGRLSRELYEKADALRDARAWLDKAASVTQRA